MKIIVTKNGVVERKIYPYIGEDSKGLLIAFTAPKTGVVIANNENTLNDYILFESRNDWIEENFHLFDGQVVLNN